MKSEGIQKIYSDIIFGIYEGAVHELDDISPSAWAEKHVVLGKEEPKPGPFSYDNSPYVKGIVDCLDVNHPAKEIAIMKGAQIGMSRGLIMNGIGYIIDIAPGNTALMVGHEDLTKDASTKVDSMIDNADIRHLIFNQSGKLRHTKSGDTDKLKEFAGGYLLIGTSNHSTLRQRSLRYGFIDDFDGMKSESKEAGDTRKLINKRFAAFKDKRKIMYISTPELAVNSNIEPVYLRGDQRKYHIECPCCQERIVLEWEIESQCDGVDMAGITWSLDDSGDLIPESVGYTCYKCGGFFDDRDKYKLLREGEWIPTAKPADPDVVSFHISALYAPPFMYDWTYYVREYIEACPLGQERKESEYKTFVNTVLGLTYTPLSQDIRATELQKNCRPYSVNTIPDKLSVADGNGKIVLLTFACDLNGKVDDARLDYEIVAWSENGQTYSVSHGSFGTFIPKDPGKIKRDKWTYRKGKELSVWPKVTEIFETRIPRDDGSTMAIFAGGIDTGYLSEYAYPFVRDSNFNIWSLRGDTKEGGFISKQHDTRSYKVSAEKKDLFIVRGNAIKDDLANHMLLNWDQEHGEIQPHGFMNFPSPSEGQYQFKNYFSHFEAEKKEFDPKNEKFLWKKKSNNHQNHLFDCRVYNVAVRDILLDKIFRERGIQNGTWADWVSLVLKK